MVLTLWHVRRKLSVNRTKYKKRSSDQKVGGSSPSGCTIFLKENAICSLPTVPQTRRVCPFVAVLSRTARFDELCYRRLFPAWWKFVKVRNSDALRETVASFWKRWS